MRPWRTAPAGPSFTTGAAFAAMPCSATFLSGQSLRPYTSLKYKFCSFSMAAGHSLRPTARVCCSRGRSYFCCGRSLRPTGLESVLLFFLTRTFPAPYGLGVRSALFFAADVPCALRAWSPFCSFFCRGRSLRPTGLESVLLFFLPRTFPAPCGLGVRSALFFAADVPCALRAWSPFCSFFCRGRSLRPTGLESVLLFFLPRTFPAPYGLGVRLWGP